MIERPEERLPPMITKDGVTVFKNLAFDDSSQHVIMEAARDAAVRTANEAGDGTTTATILAEALVRYTMAYCTKNPKVSPQRVVRRLEKAFKEDIEPQVRECSLKSDLNTPAGRARLEAVARISANGDSDLAKAVIECFDLVGDDGNVTLLEGSGSGYEVEKIEGYPIAMGYEDSCGKFYQGFINNSGRMVCEMENPVYVLYHSRLSDIYTALGIFDKINQAAQSGQISNNIVFVATGFSEQVLAHLYTNFVTPETPNIFPLQAPLSASKTGQYDFITDLAALTGGKIFDSVESPLDMAEVSDLGRTSGFEASRFRSTVIGYRDEILILERVDQLKTLIAQDNISILDKALIQERIGKMTGGIAKLRVLGSSSGEVREKRDRAEDAICAVRGAIKYGALPGGGWMLKKLSVGMTLNENPILQEVLAPALLEPIRRLYTNAGFDWDEAENLIGQLVGGSDILVYDVLEGKWVDALEAGVLDSLPAVLEAIRNSISIASLLGTCGGTVVFKRDVNFERQEAKENNEFLRSLTSNEADERP